VIQLNRSYITIPAMGDALAAGLAAAVDAADTVGAGLVGAGTGAAGASSSSSGLPVSLGNYDG